MIREHFDPVRVLGCEPEQALLLFHGRPVTPGEAEAIAGQTYPWRHHLHDPDSYWVTAGQAAVILQVPTQRVRRLLDQHRLPHIRHASGVRLMRRSQIEALKDRYGKPSRSTPAAS
jgi:CRP-like cAMP-binding protein